MEIAIMQPYFFPYIGYFQLMNAVDEFVIYDNIEFTKKGWINRNRILINGKDSYVTIPLKKDSDYLDVKDRYISDVWIFEKQKMLNRITQAYRKSPHFDIVYPVIEECIVLDEINLFDFILNSLVIVKDYLEIPTPISISSALSVENELKSASKVIAICKAKKASTYLNPVGGVKLYEKDIFRHAGIKLQFLKTADIKYKQFKNDFVPFLSIIDVMMFNSKGEIKEYLKSYYTII